MAISGLKMVSCVTDLPTERERDINSVNSETHPLALSLSYVLITSTESTISVIVGESSLIKI